MEVGAIPNDREADMADSIRTKWAIDIISKKHDKPFFVGLGIYAPHYPNYAPQRFFDMYPIESIQRPEWKEDDLDDIPESVAKKYRNRKKSVHDKLEELGEIDRTIQGYLASITYADYQLGRVLDALEDSPHAENTIIVFWSDHGYAHGEKGNWGKHTLWQRTSNIPFIWAGPGIAKSKQTEYTATLIDMYPTLAELCNLPKDPGHDGQSLESVLKNPTLNESRSVLLPHDHPGSFAIINRDWRYIYYKDGSEELYNLESDFHEWNNLAGDAKYSGVKKVLKAQAPTTFATEGTTAKALKLVTEGKSFRWVLKKN